MRSDHFSPKILKFSSVLGVLVAVVYAGQGFALNYPFKATVPLKMNDAAVGATSFFQEQGAKYNQDGTLVANPIITANSGQFVTVDSTKFSQKTLTTDNKLTFDGDSYTIYINIPEKDTIGFAYKNWQAEYPSDLSNLNITKPASDMINAGLPSTLPAGAVASVVAGTGNVRLIQAATIGDRYYIPYLPNTITYKNNLRLESHTGITENVYWDRDHYLGSTLGVTPPDHMAAYGWSLSSEKVGQPVFVSNVGSDGGTAFGAGPIVVPPRPTSNFNYFKLLIDASYYNDFLSLLPSEYMLKNLAGTTTSITPTWLQNGIYMPILAYPGFQRNLIRWYTPWGTWNMTTNTTDLYVRKNTATTGGVELPVDGSNKIIPLVQQTWNAPRFSAINETDGIVSMVVTNYPGSESYFPSNVFLPKSTTSNALQAGLIPSFSDFKIFDKVGSKLEFQQRAIDGFLGLKGESLGDTSIFYDGTPPNIDPGGQANKPYLIGASKAVISTQNQWALRVQHANSFMVANHAESESSKVYSITYYYDQGAGFNKIATFDYKWEPWKIASNGSWEAASTGSNASEGTFVPLFTLNTASFNDKVVVAKATNFSSTRVLTYGNVKQGYGAGDQNHLGGPVTYETLNIVGLKSTDKFLAVLGTSSPPPPTKGIKVKTPSEADMQLSHFQAPGAICNPATYWIPHLVTVPVSIPFSGGTFTADWKMTSTSNPACSIESVYQNPTLMATTNGPIEAQYGSDTDYDFDAPAGWTCSVDGTLVSCDKN